MLQRLRAKLCERRIAQARSFHCSVSFYVLLIIADAAGSGMLQTSSEQEDDMSAVS
jgi:hypothetical protein